LDAAWAALGAAPVPMAVMGRNGRLAQEGAAKLGWTSGPLQHNALRCGGCCQSAIGCVQNAKGAVHLTVLPDACAAGARIVSEARGERVLIEAGRATGGLLRRAGGAQARMLAPRGVGAAGATETRPRVPRGGRWRQPWLG